MAYSVDPSTGDIIINGFQNGIGPSPYSGLTDMRNMNITPVPGEASVNFSTSAVSPPAVTINITSVSGGDVFNTSATGALENRMAVQFTSVGSLTGVSTGTLYYANNVTLNTSLTLYTDLQLSSQVTGVSGTIGAGVTLTTYQVSQPKYSTYDTREGTTWIVDSAGLVWSNAYTTTSGYWVYTGNLPNNYSNGNGIVYYQASNGTGYIFVFSNSSIDYTPSANSSINYQYQWNWTAGSVGSWSATPSAVLHTATGVANPHFAFVAPDSRAYFTDGNYIQQWYQTSPSTPFVPTTIGTYTTATFTAVLPASTVGQCMAYLGTSIWIGGNAGILYQWDTFDNTFSNVMLLPESNTSNLVSVNSNMYIFCGNRGRIYITNGTQAQLWAKIPDHLSGTVEPYYQWGGACTAKNQLYFGALATTNSSGAISQYGGVWAIDLITQAIRLVNQLSYGTYAGYSTTIIPNYATDPAGTGLFIGWNNGNSGYGIDTTVSAPYSQQQAYVISDLIPIGSLLKPSTLTQIEYKLSVPLVTGESVQVQMGSYLNGSFTALGGPTNGLTTGATGSAQLSDNFPVTLQNLQWLAVKVILSSTFSSPSYCRLTQIRIIRSGDAPIPSVSSPTGV